MFQESSSSAPAWRIETIPKTVISMAPAQLLAASDTPRGRMRIAKRLRPKMIRAKTSLSTCAAEG